MSEFVVEVDVIAEGEGVQQGQNFGEKYDELMKKISSQTAAVDLGVVDEANDVIQDIITGFYTEIKKYSNPTFGQRVMKYFTFIAGVKKYADKISNTMYQNEDVQKIVTKALDILRQKREKLFETGDQAQAAVNIRIKVQSELSELSGEVEKKLAKDPDLRSMSLSTTIKKQLQIIGKDIEQYTYVYDAAKGLVIKIDEVIPGIEQIIRSEIDISKKMQYISDSISALEIFQQFSFQLMKVSTKEMKVMVSKTGDALKQNDEDVVAFLQGYQKESKELFRVLEEKQLEIAKSTIESYKAVSEIPELGSIVQLTHQKKIRAMLESFAERENEEGGRE